jgi:energy-coupling factor transporter transmembrane protein EcfT
MKLIGFGSIFVFLIASYPGLIASILIFCVSVVVLIIKRKTLKNIVKIILLILAIISAFLIIFSVYLSFIFENSHSAVIIGGADGPTAIYISGANENNGKQLKFNGVYYYEEAGSTNYFRFYDNGTVIGLTGIGKYNEEILGNWSYETYDDIIGNYTIENNSIKFSTYSGKNVIEYSGIIKNENIIINSHSNINGKDENNKIYTFKELKK